MKDPLLRREDRRAVRIVTDASYDEKLRRAGWACWIQPSGTPVLKSGVFTDVVSDNNHAELGALALGLGCAIRELKLRAGDTVIARSDSLNAIQALDGSRLINPSRVHEKRICERLHAVVRSKGLTLILEHVPGHTGKADSDSAMQSWCDKAARAALAEATALDALILDVIAA